MSAHEWLGRETVSYDRVDPRLIRSFSATLDPYLALDHAVPLGLFWCLSPEIASAADLGSDGHPRLGVVLPDLGYGRRMWAGGSVEFIAPLQPDDAVQKTSTIGDIAYRDGRTGKLAILTMAHAYAVAGQTRIAERQTIIYRAGSGIGTGPAPCVTDPSEEMAANLGPTALFRYSALTFNGHRIHYDEPYATGEEGYAGLVVHGPIQATLLLNVAAKALGRTPSQFAYRGHAPLFCGEDFSVRFGETDAGLEGCVVNEAGAMTFSATFTA
ncbi:MAG: protein dehydratase [Pseudomonadota bacterium]